MADEHKCPLCGHRRMRGPESMAGQKCVHGVSITAHCCKCTEVYRRITTCTGTGLVRMTDRA